MKNKFRFVLATSFLLLLCFAQVLTAQMRTRYPEALPGISDTYYGAFDDDNPYATKEMLDHIRREKFDFVLPRVMRDENIDMWIHIIRPWTFSGNELRKLEGLDLNYSNIDSTDPLRYEFGSNAAVLVFTDRGGEGLSGSSMKVRLMTTAPSTSSAASRSSLIKRITRLWTTSRKTRTTFLNQRWGTGSWAWAISWPSVTQNESV